MEESGTSKPTSEESQTRQGPSVCKICHRPAHGHHYGVASCKGCKTFFRRMCVSDSTLKCQLLNDCFDSSKRAQLQLRCQSCRYKKCIEVGMNSKALELNETEKEALNFKKLAEPMSGWPINRKVELPKVSRMRDVPDIDMKYSGPPARPIFSPANQKMWMFFNMMTTIEYAKTFNFFQKLDLNDQIVLVGQTTLLCMNLHNSYYAVSRKMEKCMHPDGTEQPQRDEYHYPVVSMALAPLIRCDIQPIEYILLKAIGLCNPTVHGLSEHGQTIIAKERQQFSDVLLDHCLRNRSDGPSRFVELLGIISVLLRQQRLQKDIHIYHISPIISRFPFPVQFLDEIMYS
ncbi:unnamed protein product [Caenorhabditis nigoni]